ncbi:hypothetical protein [Chitinophaga dinghuensis]|uniref:hypothetical protein n=1 Tax=Chitinophaga dinghuensis TaxID=1539050 RepID=UPI00147506E2|nr:hypothetical protein [Chitinophaga dinghuensis]
MKHTIYGQVIRQQQHNHCNMFTIFPGKTIFMTVRLFLKALGKITGNICHILIFLFF